MQQKQQISNFILFLNNCIDNSPVYVILLNILRDKKGASTTVAQREMEKSLATRRLKDSGEKLEQRESLKASTEEKKANLLR